MLNLLRTVYRILSLQSGKALESFDGIRDIKFWLRGIMRNKIVDES